MHACMDDVFVQKSAGFSDGAGIESRIDLIPHQIPREEDFSLLQPMLHDLFHRAPALLLSQLGYVLTCLAIKHTINCWNCTFPNEVLEAAREHEVWY